jgi:hypothetical protein
MVINRIPSGFPPANPYGMPPAKYAAPQAPPMYPIGPAAAAPMAPPRQALNPGLEKEEKEKLKLAVTEKCKSQIIANEKLVKERASEHFKEIKLQLDEIEKHAPVMQVNEKVLAEKKQQIEAKKQAIANSIVDLQKMTVQLKKIGAVKEITPENALQFVKGASDLHEKSLELDQKKLALEESVMQLKKAYEEKVITLQELLEWSRKMFDKEFMCIYKKKKVETAKIKRDIEGKKGVKA